MDNNIVAVSCGNNEPRISARDLMVRLDYDKWQNFEQVVLKATAFYELVYGESAAKYHFTEVGKSSPQPNGGFRQLRDWSLTVVAALACAADADSSKQSVAVVKTELVAARVEVQNAPVLSELEVAERYVAALKEKERFRLAAEASERRELVAIGRAENAESELAGLLRFFEHASTAQAPTENDFMKYHRLRDLIRLTTPTEVGKLCTSGRDFHITDRTLMGAKYPVRVGDEVADRKSFGALNVIGWCYRESGVMVPYAEKSKAGYVVYLSTPSRAGGRWGRQLFITEKGLAPLAAALKKHGFMDPNRNLTSSDYQPTLGE